MEPQLKRLVTSDEFGIFINLSENSKKLFRQITDTIVDIYNQARQDWSGGDGSFQLDAIRFKVLSAYYMDAEYHALDLDADGKEMLLRGALEHNCDIDYWWGVLDSTKRHWVCLHAFKTGNTPSRIRALYQMETLPDIGSPKFSEFVALILQTQTDEAIRVAALQVLGIRGRRSNEGEMYKIRTKYRFQALWKVVRQRGAAFTQASWKEVVFTPQIDLLISSIAMNQSMPRVSEAAARTIGQIQSTSAVRHIDTERKHGRRGALRALTLIRDESPNLPSFMLDRDRYSVWFANAARRLFDNPWGLFFRFTTALIGGWIGMGYNVFATFRAQSFFTAQRWANALALGLLFGLFVALLVIFAGEFSQRMRGFWPRWMHLIVSAILGLFFGTALWAQYHWMFLSGAGVDLYWPAILLGGIGVAAGIVITAYFALPSLPAIYITGLATYLPILYTWYNYRNNFDFSQNPDIQPLLYFLDNPSRVYSAAIPMAVFIAVGSHFPSLWRDMRQIIFPRIRRQLSSVRHLITYLGS